ncbi:MAG: hypothetical protein Q9219_000362 [cf. Caloplaca sp. 3 TL-2023]
MTNINGGPDTLRERGRQTISPATVRIRGRSVEVPGGKTRHGSTSDAQEMAYLNAELEADYSKLKQDHDNLAIDYRQKTNDILNLETTTSLMRQELDSVRLQKDVLEQQLQACRDDLYRMQATAEVPDSVITQAYDDLYQHIASWVEGEVGRFEEDSRNNRHVKSTDLFGHGDMRQVHQFLSTYSESGGEYLVRCVLQALLQEEFFGKDILLLGLDEHYTGLLRGIERSMGRAKPAKDPASIDSWRSDTLTALSELKEFKKIQRKAMAHIAEHMMNRLTVFFPIIKNNSKSLELLFDKVITPAAGLANMIQTSRTDYQFLPQIESIFQFENRIVTIKDLSRYSLVDVGTGKTLKPDSPVSVDEKGHIGAMIMILAPALYRCNPGQDALQLAKATILVKLFKPLGRRRAATVQRKEEEDIALI